MDTGKPTTPQEVLTALRARISSVTGINEKYVHICLNRSWFEPGGLSEKFVVVTDFSGTFDDGWFVGGGNDAKKADMTMSVCLYTRFDMDQVGSDYMRLTDASFGLLPEWVTLVGGLSAWLPTDGAITPQAILIQPAAVTGFAIRQRNFRSSTGWTEISTNLTVSFLLDL